MNGRFGEFLGVLSVVAVGFLLLLPPEKRTVHESMVRSTAEPARAKSNSDEADFHWFTQGDDFEYYFEVRGEDWAGLLCSEKPEGNYFVQGTYPPGSKIVAQNVLSKLLARRGSGAPPNYGLAFPPEYWYQWRRAGLLGSPTWGASGFRESFVDYGELSNDRDLVLFFQQITTNGGHRTDFKLRNSPQGGYDYELTIPELFRDFRATGHVTSEQWQNQLKVVQSLCDSARIETGSGHDCTYFTVFFRGRSGTRYYQWYEASSVQDVPQVKLVEALLSWGPYVQAEARSLEFLNAPR